MGEPRVVADVLASVVSRGDRSRWPTALVDECASALGVAGVGLAVTDDRVPVGIVAATDGVGRTGEDLQFALGEGICWHAAGARRLVQAPDLSTDDRWVQFGRSAADAGIAAAFSLPLQVGAVLVGVLDVYRRTAGPLSGESAGLLSVYGQAATAVLLLLTGDDDDRLDDAAGLTELADIRPVVHQAAGMVAIQLGVDLTSALLRLRAQAFATGRPLRDLAEDVVARRTRLDGPPDEHRRTPR
jgi:hypothetical protein